eukprot:4446533-Prorocentrum_lima.AAC.1
MCVRSLPGFHSSLLVLHSTLECLKTSLGNFPAILSTLVCFIKPVCVRPPPTFHLVGQGRSAMLSAGKQHEGVPVLGRAG